LHLVQVKEELDAAIAEKTKVSDWSTIFTSLRGNHRTERGMHHAPCIQITFTD